MFCFVNDRLMQGEEASIGINDLSILRGYGVFDFFRLNSNIPVFIEDHLDRFFFSTAQVFDQLPFSRNELSEKIDRLIKVNKLPTSGIRIVLTGGYTSDGYTLGKPNLIITQEEISFPSEEYYQNGVKLLKYRYLRELPHIKTINYMTGIWLEKEVKAQNAFDVLYHQDNNVLELTRSNFFIVTQDNQLITPGDFILKGVTRKKVLQIAQGHIETIERDIDLSELLTAKEAFLTGTTKKLLPVTQIDDLIIGDGLPGPITLKLSEKFEVAERDYLKSRQ